MQKKIEIVELLNCSKIKPPRRQICKTINKRFISYNCKNQKTKSILFSNYPTYLINQLHFLIIVTTRFLKIVFKSNRGIQLVYLNHNADLLFESSFLVIKYNFQNALYFKINNQTTLSNTPKVFNLSEITNPIEFVVYGFFQKQTYYIEFEPTLTLNSKSFNTSISNLNIELNNPRNLILSMKNIQNKIKTPKVKNQRIKYNNQNIKILTQPFNQKEFI